MSIKQIHVCDCCGTELPSVQDRYFLNFKTKTFTDAAGDTDYNFLDIELCDACAQRAVTALETIASRGAQHR